MKRSIVCTIVCGIVLSLFVSFSAAAKPAYASESDGSGLIDLKEHLFELSEDMDDDTYCWTVEKNFRVIKNLEMIFTEESFKEFNKSHRVNNRENARKCNEAIDSLVQKDSIENLVWYLWDEDNMPVVDGEEFRPGQFDEESELDYDGFMPFVIKFLQEDQTAVKGNIILCSGGGFNFRSNAGEAYKTWPIFFDMGYNVYILQRRIAPYSAEDTYMDMQRAIRLVRYHAALENYGGQDLIAAVGWSGGAGTLSGAVEHGYGFLTPADTYASSYVPDEIDQINSSLDAALLIYGGYSKIKLDQAQELLDRTGYLPAFYLCVGSDDAIVNPDSAQAFYDNMTTLGIPAQLFIVPGAVHGFGPGGGSKGGEGSENWPYEADELMQTNKGRVNALTNAGTAESDAPAADIAAEGGISAADYEIPEGYTKAKVFDGTYGFGEAQIMAAVNDDETAFYIYYIAFDEDQILEGTVEDGICSVDFDLTGFMAGDCQLIWDDALASENPWQPVE